MAGELDKLKELIMTVVNGEVSPGTVAVQKAQDAIQLALAEAKYVAEMTKIVVPQQARIASEIAKLEAQKWGKEAERTLKETEVLLLIQL